MVEDCADKTSECRKDQRTVLIYACSGAMNVAEVADRAARQVTAEGGGSMSCLAGLGAGIEDMIEAAREADLNVVIDGCQTDCGKKIFDRAGVTNYVQIKVTDLGIEKLDGQRSTEEQVAAVAEKVRVVVSST